jgi:hypothetical protein
MLVCCRGYHSPVGSYKGPSADHDYVGGRTLQDSTQQTALLEMLHDIEASTAWPARRAIQLLEEDWKPENETTSPNRQLFLEDRYHRRGNS